MELLGAGPWTRPAAPPVPGGRRPGAGEINRRRVSFSDIAMSGRVSAVRILPLSGVCDVGFLSLSQYARVCFCTSKEVAATQTLAPKCLRAHLQGKKTSSHTTSVPLALLRKSTVSVRRGPVRLPPLFPHPLPGFSSGSRTQARHCELPWVPRLFSLFVPNLPPPRFTCHGPDVPERPGQWSCRIPRSPDWSEDSLTLRRRLSLSGGRTPWVTPSRGINPGGT